MRLLLDTHALVWWSSGDQRMSAAVRAVIGAKANIVFVSAATSWEITTKFRSGKLAEAATLVEEFFTVLAACDFKSLSVSVEHAHRAGLLPGAHKDPFDRMLAAQAIMEELELVTINPKLAELGARVIW